MQSDALKTQLISKPSLGRSIVVGSGLMIMLLAVDAAINLRNIHSLHENGRWIAHTHQIEQLAADLSSSTLGAVLSQQDYLFRGFDKSLVEYQQAVSRATQAISQLKELTKDNPDQISRITEISQLLQTLFAELEDQLKLKDRGLDRAELLERVAAPRIRLQDIQRLVKIFRDEESRLLLRREALHGHAYASALLFALFSLILGLALFLGVIELVRRDFTARLTEEQRLNAEREQLAVTLANIGDAVVSTDQDQRVLQMNPAAQEFTGWSADQATGRLLTDVLNLYDIEEGADETTEPVALSRIARLRSPERLMCRARNGQQRLVEATTSTMKSTESDVQGAVTVLRDVSAQQHEERLKEENRQSLALRAELGALTVQTSDTLVVLSGFARFISAHIGGELASLWLVEEGAAKLERASCAGTRCAEFDRFDAFPEEIQSLAFQGLSAGNEPPSVPVSCLSIPEMMAFPLSAGEKFIGVLIVIGRAPLPSAAVSELRGAALLLTQFLRGRIAENARQQSLHRLRQVIDSMFAFVGIVSPQGELIESNRAPLELTGVDRAEVLGRKFWECPWWGDNPDAKDRIRAAVERAANGEIVRFDEAIILRDGGSAVIDMMFKPVFDDQQQLLFIIPSGVDVTDRKLMEDELEKSQAFLRSALNALSSQIAVLNEEGTVLAANRVWIESAEAEDTGTPFCQEGENYLQACQASFGSLSEAGAQAIRSIRDVISGRQLTFSEIIHFRCGKKTYWFQLRVTRFTGSGPTRVVVSHEDVTTKTVSDQAILRRSHQLQMLAEVAVQLSAAQDTKKVLEVVTNGARQLVDADEAETIRLCSEAWDDAQRCTACNPGLNFWLTAPQGSGDIIRNHIRTTGKPLRVSHAEWLANARYQPDLAGRVPPLGGCVAAPLTDLNGKVLGLIQLCGNSNGDFSADDEAILVQLAQMAAVTLERAQLYEEIRAADHRKDEFLATLAHELRNPLSALTAGTQLMRMRPDKAEQVAESAELVMRQCLQLSRLVDDLLDVSRISRGKIHLKISPVCLQKVAATALESARPVIQDGRHELISHICPESLFVRGDGSRLSQVLANLLVNSAKYTASGGRIELRLFPKGSHAVLEVVDNGIGIPADMLERIFEKFTQVDGTTTRTPGGLGIGLTLAKTLVTLHGGTIEVQSPAPDSHVGSLFRVQLPLIRPENDEEKTISDVTGHPADDRPAKTHRILVVDDNRAGVYLLSQLLTTLHQTVETATGARAALDLLPSFQPDIVFSDIGMPEMDGYEFARAIRSNKQLPQPILVALTGFGQSSDRETATLAGFNYHFTKPVSLEQLSEFLSQLGRVS